MRRPASLMRKSNDAHVVTLNKAALAILERIKLLKPPESADILSPPFRIEV